MGVTLEAAMTQQPDHEIVDLEDDPSVPPRPEEEIADATEPPARTAAGEDGARDASRWG